jgi:hypothetical protein
MKKFVAVMAVVLLVSGLASATSEEFSLKKIYVTPQIGLASWGGGLPFGANVEYALTENIGIAGTAMLTFWNDSYLSQSLINLAAEANYHFTKFDAKKIDLYVGAGLGYSIYSWSWKSGVSGPHEGSGSSGLYLQTVVGGRYFFTPKIAGSLRLIGSLVGHWAGFGATIGVTFLLN